MSDSSRVLRAFYIDYAAWLDNGATGSDFMRNYGLCANLYDYCYMRGIEMEQPLEDLHQQFINAGMDHCTPFNGTYGDYVNECESLTCYLNPARIIWVREHIVQEVSHDR